MTTVYYAHPMSWYGTDNEQADLQLLRLNYDKVINPSSEEIKTQLEHYIKAYGRANIMQFFAELIRDRADVVAFRPFADGRLGAGVAREVFEAHIWGKRLVRIHSGTCGPVCGAPKLLEMGSGALDLLWATLTVEETRSRIKRKML